MTLHDELDLLAAGQPAQPVDRLQAVGGRARQIRRTRAAVTGVAALAVVASGAAVLQLGDRSTKTSFASTSVTTWPDRSQDPEVAPYQGAFDAWRERNAGRSDVLTRWLYRGTLVDATGSDVRVAVFLGDDGITSSVVTAWSREQDDDGPVWAFSAQRTQEAGTLVGTYVPTGGPGGTQNLLVVLGAPDAREARLREAPLPGAPAGPEWSTTLRSTDGVFTTGPVSLHGPVSVALLQEAGEPAGSRPLSTTALPWLAEPADPDVPAGYEMRFATSGQTRVADRPGTDDPVESFFQDSGLPPGTLTAFARCYGGGSLTVRLHGTTFDGPVLGTGQVPCDSSSAQVLPPTRVTVSSYVVEVLGSGLQAYRVTLGTT